MVEHGFRKAGVEGSNPSIGSKEIKKCLILTNIKRIKFD